MAKTQSLSLNPAKISGACGRLMCCLKYEQDAYEDLVRHAPRQDSFVETPDGAGNVIAVDLLREQVQVKLESDPETPRRYYNSEVRVIRSGKGRRPEGYVQPPLEELEKLRRPVEDLPPAPQASTPLAAALDAVFHGESPNTLEEGRGRRPAKPHRGRHGGKVNPQQNQEGKAKNPSPQKAGEPKSKSQKQNSAKSNPAPKQPKGQNQPKQEGGKKPVNFHRRRHKGGNGGGKASPSAS